MSDLPTTDSAASTANKTIVEIVNDLLPIVEAAAITSQAWLGDPVVKQLWEGAFGWISGLFSTAAGTLTGYVVMDVQSYFNLTAAAKALAALQAAQQTGNVDAISQANAAADAAVAPILHYVGDDRT